MKNPYTSRWSRLVIGAFLRRSYFGAKHHPTHAARIATRYAETLKWAKALDASGAPAHGSFWRRKLTGSIWRVQGRVLRFVEVPDDGMVEAHLVRPASHEIEKFEREKFFELFEPYECDNPVS